MTHLGTLGTPREPEAVTFDYFGATFTIDDGLTDLEYLDFMEEAAEVDANSTRGRRWLKELTRLCLGEGQDVEFWRLAKRNRQTSADVFDALMKMIEAATARPTEQPSDSSDGQRSTVLRSAGISSSLADRLEKRPDMAAGVVRSLEAARTG